MIILVSPLRPYDYSRGPRRVLKQCAELPPEAAREAYEFADRLAEKAMAEKREFDRMNHLSQDRMRDASIGS